MENDSHEPDNDPLGDVAAAEDIAGATGIARHDGWTPFARRLFLEVLADTGRVSLACEYTQRSRQSAYALRARDHLFAAGWDAAAELARAPLADSLYERALDGTTETITRNGEVVAERHRHDSRLSIAVLHRLDKRCDRAEERGSKHLAIAAHWNSWLELIGKGHEDAARQLLDPAAAETAQHCQHCQLSLGENPTAREDRVEDIALGDRCWRDEDGLWVTDFPPPPHFDGFSYGEWDDDEGDYERSCTAEEAALLDAHERAVHAADREDQGRLRDRWFDLIRIDLDSADSASPDGSQGSETIAQPA